MNMSKSIRSDLADIVLSVVWHGFSLYKHVLK